jgi:acetyltransferase-like isoleucine patch superfamily enzyme
MKKHIVIIGWGEIAELLCEFPNVIGYVKADNLDEIVCHSTKKTIAKFDPKIHVGVIGIGKAEYKELRARQWADMGYRFGTLVHPSAYVSPNALIGEGSVVMPLAFVDNKSVIGHCSIIGPQSALRIATIGDYCHLTLQTKILPHARLEDKVFIGSGATVLEDRFIGEGAAIGANTVVSKDVPAHHLYVENSSQKILKRIYTTYPLTTEEKKLK